MEALNQLYQTHIHQDQEKDYFIISKEFTIKEDEVIEFLTYYDTVNNSTFTLIIRENKIFLCMKLSQFGSVFFGNAVFEEPKSFIIKEIDPLLIIINVIYATTKLADNDKFSFSEVNNFIHVYIENLRNDQKKYKLEDSSLESTIKVLNFIRDHFNGKNKIDLEKICEMTFNTFTDSNHYKLLISKILNYYSKKLNNLSNESIRNVVSIITLFLPSDIAESLLKFKNVNLDEEDPAIREAELEGTNVYLKRKYDVSETNAGKLNKNETVKKKNNNKNVKDDKSNDKSQKSMLSFLKKK